jgi:hypothetical protein
MIKRTLKYLLFSLTVLTVGCKNNEVEFNNFDYTSVYFPYQYPVRTLVLGDDYNLDNSNDNLHRFEVSVVVGGLYKNTKGYKVNFLLDPTIVTPKLAYANGSLVKVLPSNYFTISNNNEINIKPGSMDGRVTVQLTDLFFQDPLSVNTTYVIPMRITATSADSILVGKPSVSNPNRFLSDNYDIVPKDFTLFAIKYVNPEYGNYLRRGVQVRTKTLDNSVIGSFNYHQAFVEKDEVVAMTTKSLTASAVPHSIKVMGNGVGNAYTLNLEVASNGTIAVSKGTGSTYDIVGTGKIVKEGEMWGGKKRTGIYLDYKVTVSPTEYLAVKDTLAYRDKGIGYETYIPQILP